VRQQTFSGWAKKSSTVAGKEEGIVVREILGPAQKKIPVSLGGRQDRHGSAKIELYVRRRLIAQNKGPSISGRWWGRWGGEGREWRGTVGLEKEQE